MKRHQVQASTSTSAAMSLNFKFPTTSDGYTIITQIGVSPHSIVYMATCKSEVSSTTITVAVKVIDIHTNIDIDSVNTSLSQINHPNILRPHCCFFGNDGRLWIVMPFIRTGPLQSILSHSFPRGMPDHFISILLNQLLRALVYLHERGFVHKAIKPSNIFFDSQGFVKVSDFDIKISKNDCNTIDHDDSIPYWVPPDEEYGFKSDVWGVGIFTMEVTWGGPPIIDPRIIESQSFNISRRFPYELKADQKSERRIDRRLFGDSVKEFVKFCLVKDRFGRPSVSSLLRHPFVTKGESSNFLFRSISRGVTEIDKRFEQEKERLVGLMKNDNEKLKSKSQSDKTLNIIGWDYNDFLFELEPDEDSVGKRVRFGGETIWEFKEEKDEKEGKEEKEEEEITKVDDISSLLQVVQSTLSDPRESKEKIVDQETLVKMLSSLLGNIDQQREMVLTLINHFGNLITKDAEKTDEIKRLQGVLESEKERYFQLELECEFLKLKVPESEEENEYSDEEEQGSGEELEQEDP